MKPVNINIKSIQPVIETVGKKLRQWKHYLPLINLALLVGSAGLAIACVLLVYHAPENITKPEKHVDESLVKKNSLPPLVPSIKTTDYYELILSNNPFSPNRTAWVPPETKTDAKHEENASQASAQTAENQQKPKGIPKKITLRGIVILGDTRKALIENPDQTKNKKPFIFIEEGEEIAEYKVKNIEQDQVKLDWYGEEHIVIMRSNIKK
ncbi:MAG TPA: hypothetical protein ACFYEK_03380 [Candidatus Wunengus sp. YC60]|uniref:hypothetical protein n=1 Tax=Candidatus Wunengus sp. YC60 TaxID=3367697 RepID=UPI004028D6C3